MTGNLKSIPISNQFHSCEHITWNNKNVLLRSSYELDFAKELDEKRIDYDVEFKRIKYWDTQKQKYRFAIPDFYIPSTNTIVEIKSSWTIDIQNIKDRFKRYQELGYKTILMCDHREIDVYSDEQIESLHLKSKLLKDVKEEYYTRNKKEK